MAEAKTLLGGVTKDTGYVDNPKNLVGRFANWIADHSSPILVKEVRQAFSGRMFFLVFHFYLLVILLGALYTISAVESFSQIGQYLSLIVLQIVSIPLLVIVPMICFRALASEYEFETIQLISITSLNASRIINGKLGCGLLQMAIFLAAAVPFLVFCLLFEYVDIVALAWLIGFLATFSIGLSSVAVLFASFSSNKILLAGLNLLIFLGCSFACAMTMAGMIPFFSESLNNMPAPSQMFTICIVFILALTLFCRSAAVSLISFRSENRTTRIRVGSIGLLLVFCWGVVWMILMMGNTRVGTVGPREIEVFQFILIVINMVIALFGACSAVEDKMISTRVRRELWAEKWWRPLTIFLRPGPGKGFLFYAILMMVFNFTVGVSTVLVIMTLQNSSISDAFRMFWDILPFFFAFGVLNTLYGMFHMSMSYLMLLFFKWIKGRLNLVFALVSVVLLFLLFAFVTASASTFIETRRIKSIDHQIFDVMNWVYFLPEMVRFDSIGLLLGTTGYPVETVVDVVNRLFLMGIFVGIPTFVMTFWAGWLSVGELYHGSAAEKKALGLE